MESADLPQDPAEFTARLEYSLGIWKAEGVKVVWLAVSRAQSLFIPQCVAAGFIFHHAVEDRLQMTLALVPGSFIPHIRSRIEEKTERIHNPEYKARLWVIEVSYSWINWFCKLLVRFEKLTSSYLGLLMLAFRKANVI